MNLPVHLEVSPLTYLEQNSLVMFEQQLNAKVEDFIDLIKFERPRGKDSINKSLGTISNGGLNFH
jgi:hypothetical protein